MKAKLFPDLKCPRCGSDDIQSEDVYGIEGGIPELIEECVGVCRKCGIHLQWEQVYKFVGFRYIESVE
jgi:hypothetical protein